MSRPWHSRHYRRGARKSFEVYSAISFPFLPSLFLLLRYKTYYTRFLQRRDLEDAISCGADVVVQSTHKTLTSLSQTGMLHLGGNGYGDAQSMAIEVHNEYFSMLTTTSPNAVLLASIDHARSQAFSHALKIRETAELVDSLRERIRIADNVVRLLEDSPLIKNSIEQGMLSIDPLRLCVQFEGRETRCEEIDNEMCKRMGIFCELNERAAITYAIPP